MMQRVRWCIALSAALLVGVLASVVGCGGGSQQPGEKEKDNTAEAPPAEELVILCGSSFRLPMEKLVDMYEKETGNHLLLSFGGSEDHLPKVKLKAIGDIYVAHTPYMQYTRDAGAMLREVQVGFLAPVLVVRKGNPKNLKRFEDLAQEGLEVVLPDPQYSTCGEMVFKLLEKKGIKDAVLKNVGNAMVRQHATVGTQLKLGAREAGIMWNGVAHNFQKDLDIIPLPYEYDNEIRVAVMGLSYTKHKQAVEKFLDFVAEHGPGVFAEFGYVK